MSQVRSTFRPHAFGWGRGSDSRVGSTQGMGGEMTYKDAQQEARSMFSPSAESLDAAKANVIYEAWTRTRTGEELWLVFVNAENNDEQLTFAYPINAEPGTPVGDVISHAQMQHEQYGRPPKVGRVEYIRVTQEVIN